MKKKISVAIIVLLSFISVLFIYSLSKNKNVDNPQATQIPKIGASYNEITPNLSSKEDLYNKLGNPIKQNLINNSTVFEYKSNNPNYNDEFKIDSDKVVFIKKHITIDDNVDVKTLTEKYGQYKKMLYGPRSQSGFDLYIYNTKGIAYIGNQYTEDVTEIWYFPPTDLEIFKKLYAPEYSDIYNTKQ